MLMRVGERQRGVAVPPHRRGIFALVLGLIVFGEFPTTLALIAAAIVVCHRDLHSGRERMAGSARRRGGAPPGRGGPPAGRRPIRGAPTPMAGGGFRSRARAASPLPLHRAGSKKIHDSLTENAASRSNRPEPGSTRRCLLVRESGLPVWRCRPTRIFAAATLLLGEDFPEPWRSDRGGDGRRWPQIVPPLRAPDDHPAPSAATCCLSHRDPRAQCWQSPAATDDDRVANRPCPRSCAEAGRKLRGLAGERARALTTQGLVCRPTRRRIENPCAPTQCGRGALYCAPTIRHRHGFPRPTRSGSA